MNDCGLREMKPLPSVLPLPESVRKANDFRGAISVSKRVLLR
jgi:hypothetical protein